MPGAALLFFLFRFEYLISGPKSYRDFRETGPRSRIPTPFPQESRIPNFCHHHPKYRFLSQSGIPCPNFGESRFSGKSQISYPINVSRIPHCILVKFRLPGVPFQDEPDFVSGLGSLSLPEIGARE